MNIPVSFDVGPLWTTEDFDALTAADYFENPPQCAIKVLAIASLDDMERFGPACWYVATSLAHLETQLQIDHEKEYLGFRYIVQTPDFRGWKLSVHCAAEEYKFCSWDDIVNRRRPKAKEVAVAAFLLPKQQRKGFRTEVMNVMSLEKQAWAYPCQYTLPTTSNNQKKRMEGALQYIAPRFPDVAFATQLIPALRIVVQTPGAMPPPIPSRCDDIVLNARAERYVDYKMCTDWLSRRLLPARKAVACMTMKLNGKTEELEKTLEYEYPYFFPATSPFRLHARRDLRDTITGASVEVVPEVVPEQGTMWGDIAVFDSCTTHHLRGYFDVAAAHADYSGDVLQRLKQNSLNFLRIGGELETYLEHAPRVQPLNPTTEWRHGNVFRTIQDRSENTIAITSKMQRAVLFRMIRMEDGLDPNNGDILFTPLGDFGCETHELLACNANHRTLGIRAKSASTSPMRGGLLVAPCGWGKTFISLALILRHASPRKTLLVCPKSLTSQWANAVRDKTSVPFHVLDKKSSAQNVEDATVVIVTYKDLVDVFLRDASLPLKQMPFERVIFDESHVMKKEEDEAARCIKTTIRWGLTATPLYNQQGLLGWQMNAILGYNFLCTAHGGRFFLDHCTLLVDADEALTPTWTVTEHDIETPSPPAVREKFQRMKDDMHQERGWNSDNSKLARILLRKVAAGMLSTKLPALINTGTKRMFRIFDTDAGTCSICLEPFVEPGALPCGHVFCTACLTSALRMAKKCPQCRAPSGKIVPYEEAQEIIARNIANQASTSASASEKPAFDPFRVHKARELVVSMAPDDKVLVFSQYDMVLDATMAELRAHGITAKRFLTHKSLAQRREMLNEFERDPEFKVLLLNVRMCNAGLNLMAANKVIFLEPCLSDDVRTQAIGRVNRNGQTRDVDIYTLIDSTTV
jgi:hypothetical protein